MPISNHDAAVICIKALLNNDQSVEQTCARVGWPVAVMKKQVEAELKSSSEFWKLYAFKSAVDSNCFFPSFESLPDEASSMLREFFDKLRSDLVELQRAKQEGGEA